ncbi:MAG TPA: helix-turn-helix domain-containing protein, partial [Paenibacillaceae bacterium]
MTKNELKRVMVIEKWIDGHLAEQDVARNLGISVRQAYRLKAKYRQGRQADAVERRRSRRRVHDDG